MLCSSCFNDKFCWAFGHIFRLEEEVWMLEERQFRSDTMNLDNQLDLIRAIVSQIEIPFSD